MYVLKQRMCDRCKSYISVSSYRERDENGKDRLVVDCGTCITCGKIEILPQDDFKEFVSEHCISMRRLI